MKTLKLISIVIMLALPSCRSREMSFGRSKTSEIAREKISLNESRSEITNRLRVLDIKDSSKQFVGVRIYPLDTFSLSGDKGFKGRATMIEYWGLKERVSTAKDSSALAGMKDHNIIYAGENEIGINAASKTRYVSKESIGMVGGY